MDKLTKRLKSQESQIKQYNIDFNPIYAGIEVSCTQCETKLALMEMFNWGKENNGKQAEGEMLRIGFVACGTQLINYET